MEKSENLKNHALILLDCYSDIYSIRAIAMVLKWLRRHIFSFITIQFIQIRHFFAKIFGRCADILTFYSECVFLNSNFCWTSVQNLKSTSFFLSLTLQKKSVNVSVNCSLQDSSLQISHFAVGFRWNFVHKWCFSFVDIGSNQVTFV